MNIVRVLIGGRKERLVFAWIGSLASLLSTLISVLVQIVAKFLSSRNARIDPEDFLIWPMRIAAGITLAGPVLVLVGAICWFALLEDESVGVRTKITIGVCLVLSTCLIIAFWIRFASLGDG